MFHRLIIGAMSGTSADGVDAAAVRVHGTGLRMTADLIGHTHRPYPPGLRSEIFGLRSTGRCELHALAQMGRDITLLYAEAVREAMSAGGLRPLEIAGVAAHGQTLFHAPPSTIQWFDPSLLAWETGCAVVSDFRRADCAAGGQGAPLVPFADFLLFSHPRNHRVLLNIGGIANITSLRAGGSIDELIAFDTGPGNCISDWLCRTHDPAGPGFDAGGERAARGKPSLELAQAVCRNPYFSRPPPKSTDGPEMIRIFNDEARRFPHLGLGDLLRTSCVITAQSIRVAMADLLHLRETEIIASGGGCENKTLMEILASDAGGMPVMTTDALDIPSAAKEAIAFALLGAATLDRHPSNVPSVTGARRPVILGSITPAPPQEK
ncbi:MAG TPA: anhydro-N-acetylmuramic acid kinase [Tepidisphaeraceae bacterium]|jgi:anhydro-N-acetylmuramic acid kinase|nr:anhydro-N-acetylmuramic acid kinase [Tepidisphaeraceae bacterium]